MLLERLLQDVELAIRRGESLDRRQLAPVRLHGEHQAGTGSLSVHQHRAGAAYAVLAAEMGAGEPELVAQEIGERDPRFDTALVRLAVDR